MFRNTIITILAFLVFFVSTCFAANQENFPNIYIDADADNGGVGSLADPYNDLSDINQSTGGDNSIYDYLNGTPSQNVVIHLQKGDIWRETLTIGVSGTSSYKIILSSYGTGDLPVITGAEAMTGWTYEDTNLYYASSVTANPDHITFFNTNGTFSWGLRETVKGNVNAEYDWYYDSGNDRVYVYSAGAPGSTYTAIERTARSYGITNTSGYDYWIIDGIEIRDVGTGSQNNKGINLTGGADNWEIRNCYIHHIGHKEATEYGDAVYLNKGDNLWVHDNVISEGGRHLVYLYCGSSGNCRDAIIEKNYLHNGYHTSMDMNGDSFTEHSGHIWRNNYVYFDGTDLDGEPGGFFINGNGTAIDDIHIYGNIFDGEMYYALNLYSYITNLNFFNNSVYLYEKSSGNYGIQVETTGINYIDIRNNIVYMDTDSSASGCYNINTNTVFDAIDYNVCYNPDGYAAYDGSFRTWSAWRTTYPSFDANSYNEDPDFDNKSSQDFTLQSGAPGIGTGYTLGASWDDFQRENTTWSDDVESLDVLIADRDDYASWDIGAYEYGSETDTHYMATGGTDSGTCGSGSPCLTLQYTMSQMASGDTLEIANGTYQYTGSAGNDNYITNTYGPPSGPGTGSGDARFTIIKATNPGNVKFDLGTNGVAFLSLSDGTDYIKIDGLLLTHGNSSGDARYLAYINGGGSDHIYFKRCGFYRTGGGGAATVWVSNSYNLFEDCYFYGKGRYGINLRTPGDYSIVRRCVFRQDNAEAGGLVIAAAISYEQDYVEWQNNIVIDSDRDDWSNYTYPYGGLITHKQADGDGTHYNYFRGNIVLNMDTHYTGSGIYGFGILLDGSTTTNCIVENNVVWDIEGHGISAGGGTTNTADNNTVGEVEDSGGTVGDGIRYFNGTSNSVTDNIVYSCRDGGLVYVSANDYDDVNGNGDDFDNAANDPETNGVTYVPTSNGLSYLPRIEAASNLAADGSGGGRIGAQIIYKIGIDGTFYGEDVSGGASTDYKNTTANDLWPFPNEDTIRIHMREDTGSTDETRGFCATNETLTRYIWEYLGNSIPCEIYDECGGGDGDGAITGITSLGVSF